MIFLILIEVIFLYTHPVSGYDWIWRPGRGTFYGTDGWNIFKGSCLYGELGRQEVRIMI